MTETTADEEDVHIRREFYKWLRSRKQMSTVGYGDVSVELLSDLLAAFTAAYMLQKKKIVQETHTNRTVEKERTTTVIRIPIIFGWLRIHRQEQWGMNDYVPWVCVHWERAKWMSRFTSKIQTRLFLLGR